MSKRATYRYDEETGEIVEIVPSESEEHEWKPTDLVSPVLHTGQYL